MRETTYVKRIQNADDYFICLLLEKARLRWLLIARNA
jgi:hypothetical protein